MKRIGHLLPALMLAASACVYNVSREPLPQIAKASAPLPLRVGVTMSGNEEGESGVAFARKKGGAARWSGMDGSEPLAAALRETGLFEVVHRVAQGTSSGYDVIVSLSAKHDRGMHTFFPFFFPFCDPFIIGCFPFYPISERFTAEVQATVAGGPVYTEQGESRLHCTGPCGCVPASEGDPMARRAAVANAAAKIAADFVKDVEYYRSLTARRNLAERTTVPAASPELSQQAVNPVDNSRAGGISETAKAPEPQTAQAPPEPSRPRPVISDDELLP